MHKLALVLLIWNKYWVIYENLLPFVICLNLLINSCRTTRLQNFFTEVVSRTFFTRSRVKVSSWRYLMDVPLRNLLTDWHHVVVGPAMHVARQKNLTSYFYRCCSHFTKCTRIVVICYLISVRLYSACQPGFLSRSLTILTMLGNFLYSSDRCFRLNRRLDACLSLVNWPVFLKGAVIEQLPWSLRHPHIVDWLLI